MASLGIFDLAGRMVRELAAGSTATGLHALLWDGCNEQGQPVERGVYFVRLSVGKHQVVRQVTIMR